MRPKLSFLPLMQKYVWWKLNTALIHPRDDCFVLLMVCVTIKPILHLPSTVHNAMIKRKTDHLIPIGNSEKCGKLFLRAIQTTVFMMDPQLGEVEWAGILERVQDGGRRE